MKFKDIQAGQSIGIRSHNPNALRYYRYETASVREVREDDFRVGSRWYPKSTGRLGDKEIVTAEERDENNNRFWAAQRCERYGRLIQNHLSNFGNSAEDSEVLSQVETLLATRVRQINEHREQLQAASQASVSAAAE